MDAQRHGTLSRAAGRLTAVVPTLDEERKLPGLLDDLSALGAEVVVSDGGSTDRTVEIARSRGALVIRGRAGRGVQLRRGADAARTPWMFFVHADSRLGPDARSQLHAFLDENDPRAFAHFRFRLDHRGPFTRFIEFGQRLRERHLELVYGDQGLVVHRSLYEEACGYPAWPLMEDVEMIDRLGRVGRRVALDADLVTSRRRYDEEGGLRSWLRNVVLMIRFRMGASPQRLAAAYPPRTALDGTALGVDPSTRTPPDPAPSDKERAEPSALVGVFAKAPVAGRVKTRLAADLGEAAAVEVYRTLGRRTVDTLRGGRSRVVVFYDPPDPAGRAAVASWLGEEGVDLRPQAGGDLGRRMAEAIREGLRDVDRVCLVGTDLPDLERPTVEGAFRALDSADVVLGPATDGGYYLVGMSRLHDELFDGVEWSSPTVLSETLERARAAGLTVHLLEPRTDVDRAEDLPAELAREVESRA